MQVTAVETGNIIQKVSPETRPERIIGIEDVPASVLRFCSTESMSLRDEIAVPNQLCLRVLSRTPIRTAVATDALTVDLYDE